ncbi:MAG: hypothetical protein MUF49_15620 [Oculatellaceae cyanobacterium Prado106]|jgi:hypothetical protein|nr:hypothetical protein [Oculatellaceae cyanobacterium Prado106]
MLSEVFLEINFEDSEEAQRQRDLRMEVLQAQGWVCVPENPYRVDGKRIYLLTADMPSSPEDKADHSPRRKTKPTRSDHAKNKFERR